MAKRRKAGTETALNAAWRASRPGLAAVGVFTLVFNLLKFAVPLYLLQTLDRVPASRSIETLVMLTVMAVIAVACGLALDIVRARMLVRWGGWIERQFGPRMVHQGLTAAGPDRKADDITRGLADLEKLRAFAADSLASWLDVVFVPLFVLGVFLIHPALGLVAVAALVILLGLGVLSDRLTREPRRVAGDAGREAAALMVTADLHRDSVGGLAMGPALAERWRQTAQARSAEREVMAGRQATLRTLMRGVGQFLRIAMIAVGVWLVVQNALSLGGIFAARIMAGFAFTLAEKAIRKWRNLRETTAAYGAVRQRLIDAETPALSVLPGTEDGPLVLDAMAFRYPGERTNLYRNLSLTLRRGELLLVNGTAGTGKSTLSRLLVGVLEPRDGQIRLGDVDMTRLPDDLRARLIGYMPQHTELFAGTVRENIARMGGGDLEAVVEVARLAGIHDLIVRLPEGYDTVIGPDSVGLSGSERKRIALARALYGHPRLIVLDEPSANLDSPSRRIMEAALKARRDAGASIVVTQSIHSAQIARLADLTLTLDGQRHEIVENPERRAPRSGRSSRNGLRSVT